MGLREIIDDKMRRGKILVFADVTPVDDLVELYRYNEDEDGVPFGAPRPLGRTGKVRLEFDGSAVDFAGKTFGATVRRDSFSITFRNGGVIGDDEIDCSTPANIPTLLAAWLAANAPQFALALTPNYDLTSTVEGPIEIEGTATAAPTVLISGEIITLGLSPGDYLGFTDGGITVDPGPTWTVEDTGTLGTPAQYRITKEAPVVSASLIWHSSRIVERYLESPGPKSGPSSRGGGLGQPPVTNLLLVWDLSRVGDDLIKCQCFWAGSFKPAKEDFRGVRSDAPRQMEFYPVHGLDPENSGCLRPAGEAFWRKWYQDTEGNLVDPS